MKERADLYQRDPEALIRDWRGVQRDLQTVMEALTGKVRRTWGEKEIKVPERKRYVKYTQSQTISPGIGSEADPDLPTSIDEAGTERPVTGTRNEALEECTI